MKKFFTLCSVALAAISMNAQTIGEAYTDIDALADQDVTFAIVNEADGMALYSAGNQNLGYADYATAFSNTLVDADGNESEAVGYLWRVITCDDVDGYYLQLVKLDGSDYNCWGMGGYLNSQPLDGWCSFILGLNNQNGQDLENGAVWNLEYTDGSGWTLQCVGTEGYMGYGTGTTSPDNSGCYWQFVTVEEGEAALASVKASKSSVVYNILGQEVKEAKGLVIVNGKKTVIK